MKKLLISLSIFLFVISCFAQSDLGKSTQVRRSYVIVAFGTSLTEATMILEDRWTTMLQDTLRQRHPDRNITVINAGLGGTTTRDRLPRLEKDVLERHPDLVIHDFAVNDANYEPERHVYLDEFARNIKTMHEQVVNKTGAAEIYWPQTPILSQKHPWRQQPLFVEAGGLDKYAEAYRKCTAKMSRKLHVPFVDMDAIFRKKFKEKGAEYYLCSDGIHHLGTGFQLVVESLLPVVEKVMRMKEK